MKARKITLGLLVFYFIALMWVIVFKLQFSFEQLPSIRSINVIPFGDSVIVNGKLYFGEIIRNVMAFIPFGVFIHALWEDKPLPGKILPIISTSLLLELIQYVLAAGASDITDVISNSAGGIAGIGIAVVISKISKNNWKKIINVVSIVCAVLLVLLIAVIFWANR